MRSGKAAKRESKGSIQSPTNPTRPIRKPVKVFISHSSNDASLVRLIVDFLETSELDSEEIRCTSVRGHGLKISQIVSATLRQEIQECKIVIGVLTKAALASSNVLLELGAGWGFQKILIPVRGPGVSPSDLPAWLQEPHGMRWNHRACWEQFEEILRDELGKGINDEERFHEIIYELIHWQPRSKEGKSA
jgi:hypothetical protein